MPSPSQRTLLEAFAAIASGGLVRRLLELARDEDLGPDGFAALGSAADLTSAATARVRPSAAHDIDARVVVRPTEGGAIVAGLAAAPMLLDVFGGRVRIEARVHDGARVASAAPDTIATLHGPLADVLAVERTLLNLLGRLGGVATRTAEFVDAIRGTPAVILDTRKTTPGLRVLEKYAVRCGGGHSHRMGLHDALLIKDNHIAGVALDDLAGVVSGIVAAARELNPSLSFAELEVDSLAQLERVLAAGGCGLGIILVDNLPPPELARAVALRDRSGLALLLEASGGVRLETVRAIAESGVDRISAGTLTHGATWIDVGLDR